MKDSLVAVAAGDKHAFFSEHHAEGLRPFVFAQWDMVAVELEIRVEHGPDAADSKEHSVPLLM